MSTSIDAEKLFGNIQYSFMIKNFYQTKNGNSLNLQTYKKNHIASILNSQKLDIFYIRLGQK